MEFRILGPLHIEVGGRRGEVRGPPRLRALLGALLVRVGDVVPVEELAMAVWGASPPAASRAALPTYVTRLRGLLRAVGSTARIEHTPAGYRFAAALDAVDVAVFRALLRRAERQEGHEQAATLREALALWRGAALAGIESDHLQRDVVPELDEMRLEALQRRLDLELGLGQPTDVIAELRMLTERHPLRERFWLQLMTALHRAGRRGEALDAFRAVRRRLVDDLGIEPGPDLRDMHAAILRGEAPAATPAIEPAIGRPTPAQLPADAPTFTGRERELALLSRALRGRGPTDEPSDGIGAVAAICGLGGIGKTWLALHWAHRHKDAFPDGQLFVDLRGFDPSGQMMTPGSALRGFLDALGVPPQSIPTGRVAQAGLYRSLVAPRRMLIVLDNARDAGHVVDLLPGSSGSVVIVTSRDRLIGLVTQHGAQPVPLEVLTTAQAERVLITRLGARVAAPEATVAAVVAACGGLPLALGIAAARAAVLPRPSLAVVAAELRDVATRLSALDEEHPHSSLRSVMSWSCGTLTDRQLRVFALVGVAPGPDVGLAAAGALAGLSPELTVAALRALERQSLISQNAAGRWRMHDLVRLYAAERARHLVGHDERRSALRRLVTFHLHAAYAADRLMAPYRDRLVLDGPAPAAVGPFADRRAALAWLTTEQPGLRAVQTAAMEAGWHVAAWQLAWALDAYLRWRGELREHVTMWRAGLAAALRAGDPDALIVVRRLLAHACARLGRHDDAAEQMAAAMSAVQRSGDRPALASLHRTYAQVCDIAGRRREALDHARASLRLFRELDDEPWVSAQLNAVGWYSARLGLYEPAREHLSAALALARDKGHAVTEAGTLDSLGYLAHQTGDHALAARYYRQGADLHHRNSDAYSEAETLEHLGDAEAAQHDRVAATRTWRRALELYRAQHRVPDAERVARRLGG